MRKTSSFLIPTPKSFDLKAVVTSHGWFQLAPFRFDPVTKTLGFVARTLHKAPTAFSLRANARGLEVATEAAVDRAQLCRVLKRILGLSTDLEPFHAYCRRFPALRWMARKKLGRFLAGEDLFEDMAKTLLTTNCTWSQTRSMVERLVQELGAEHASGRRAFPKPEAVANASEEVYAQRLRIGYRARGLRELARRTCEGELKNVEMLPTEDLYRTLRGFYGFGDYAASSLLLLLGRRDRLVVDSWALARAREVHGNGRKISEAKVRKIYSIHEEHRALVAWFDLNREEFQNPSATWLSSL